MAVVTAEHKNAVAAIYAALFDRAPDAEGFDFWAQALADGVSAEAIAHGFITSPEARALYPEAQDSSAFVTAYYTTVLGRTPDADGLVFWTRALDAMGGAASDDARAWLIQQIVNEVSTPLATQPAGMSDEDFARTQKDRGVFANKIEVGVYYADVIGGTDLATAKYLLSNIDETGASVEAAKGELGTPQDPGTGSTYELTDGADVIIGTIHDDTFTAVVRDSASTEKSTLTIADDIAGGGGLDVLKIDVNTSTTNLLGGARVGSIERIEVTYTDANAVPTPVVVMDAGTPSGLEYVLLDGGGAARMRVENVGSKTSVGVLDDTDAEVSFADGVTAGTVVADGSTSITTPTLPTPRPVDGATIIATGSSLTSLTLRSTGSVDNVVGSIGAASNVSTLTIDAVTDGTTLTVEQFGNFATNAALKITGSGEVVLENVASKFATIDASGSNQLDGVTVKGNTLSTLRFTGSSGADRFELSNLMDVYVDDATNNARIDAAGNSDDDVLAVTADGLITAGNGEVFRGFEIVELANGVTLDFAPLYNKADGNSGDWRNTNRIDTVDFVGGTGTTTATNVAAYQGTQFGPYTLNVKVGELTGGGAVVLGLDTYASKATGLTLNFSVDNTDAVFDFANVTVQDDKGNDGVSATSMSIEDEGSQNITIDLNDASFASITKLTLDTSGTTFVTVGSQALTSFTLDGEDATFTLDGEDATGTINVNASSATTGTTLIGGAGADVIRGSLQLDTLTGNGGKDMFVLSSNIGSEGVDWITDLDLGGADGASSVDTIRVIGPGNGAVTIATLDVASVNELAGLDASNVGGALTLVLQDMASGSAVLFTVGAGADARDFILYEADGNAGFDSSDFLVEVTGVTGTFDASDIGLGLPT